MSAISCDSPVKRSARSRPRPIVLPSMIPDTDSDSDTSADRSASRRWRSVVILRRTCPTRRVSHTNGGTKTSEIAASRQSRMHHRDDRRDHGRRVLGDRGGGRRDDAVDPADVVGDPRLHLAGARAREERERHPLQMAVDGGAQVVHHPLADHVRDVRLPDADRGRLRSRSRSSRAPARSAACRRCRAAPYRASRAAGTARSCSSPEEKTISADDRRAAAPGTGEQRARSGACRAVRSGSISGGGLPSPPPARIRASARRRAMRGSESVPLPKRTHSQP